MKQTYSFKIIISIFLTCISHSIWSQYQMENLDRGVVAVSMGGSKVFVSWRWLGTEPDNTTFNLYRNGTKLNSTPLTVTNYTDNSGSTSASYTVRAIINGVEQADSKSITPWANQYLKVPIQAPAGGTSPDGVAYTYNANDASIADLDGDGTWEIILKWDPSNSHDNSQSGYTGNTYVDAYKLNGTRMWRIDFGVNIRSGAHYMDFMVYDFDGDGKAEMMCKTGDGTKDGTGKVIGSAGADYRSSSGYILTGPEYLSIFNGQTGAVMATANYIPARGTVSSWGDSYGNRVDRFRAGVAYLDGKKPSGIFCRGYYTRLVVAAWDWDGKTLSNRWTFDSGNSSSNDYYSQGDHSLSIADVDNDGKQEIISGAAIIDDNGTGYYSTRYGHGDALHVSDLDPDLPGLEVFNIQEPVAAQGAYMYNTKDKKVLWTKPTASGSDEGPGRGVCADISAAYKGAESWVAGGGISGVFDCKGNVTGLAAPPSCNFLVWWDGDLLRELLNNTMIDKYGSGRMLTAYNIVPIASNNGTKSTPCLSGDILGDWREEVIWRASANDALYIFTTNISSTYKFRTLLHDPQYRVAIAWQNTGYNQPPHVGFYLGEGMSTPPAPNITIVGPKPPVVSLTAPANNSTFTTPANVTLTATASDADGSITKVEFYNGTTLLGSDASSPYSFDWTNVAAGTYTITAKATDNSGATTTSSAITITIKPANVLPVVSIATPANNSTFTAPATISLKATATDSDGSITKVEFYNGTILLSSDASSPYSFDWTNVAAGTYTITAKATDNSSAVTTSSAITITVKPANVLPAVSITAPANNSTFTAPATILLTATATDSDGSITKVEFYNGTILLSSDASSPYSFDWTNVAAGTYTITAKATDNSSAVTTSSAITITVKPANALPVVSLTAPANNATAPATISLTATATDSDGSITKVEFYNGATLLGSDASSPYSFDWTNVVAGTYTITAKATDNSGAATTSSAITITVKPANVLPVVSITAPANNSTFTAPATISLTATATDADGSITKVEFYNSTTLLGSDTSSPYSFDWTNVAAGTYTITAKATDNSGATATSSAISIEVKPANVLPTVEITSPTDNTVYTYPATVAISAVANDQDGSIVKVDFYNGTTLLGTDTNYPYEFTWTNPVTGIYTITAKVTDNNGGVSQSTTITIEVKPANEVPVIEINSPANNAIYSTSSVITISANATDADGFITKVDFYNGAALIASDDTAPYTYELTNVAAGTYTIVAKATDNNGAVSSDALNITVREPNSSPSVSIVTPANNQVFHASATVTIDVAVSDPDGTISSVSFFNGTTLLGTSVSSPFSYSWNNVPAGSYSITAVAKDNEDATTTSVPVVIVVNSNEPPVIAITAPLNNTVVTTPGQITVTAVANDADGTIAKVDFYSGSQLIGTVTTAPYNFSWTGIPAGNYSIIAKATDNDGAVTASSPVTVSVQDIPSGLISTNIRNNYSSVYPNPLQDEFIVQSPEDIASIRVMNIYGEELVLLQNIASGQPIPLTSDLKDGTYILNIEYKSGWKEMVKIVKLK